jgi:restriction system protein
MTTAWIVRAGKNGVYIDNFLDDGIVWVGIARSLARVAPDIDKPQLMRLIKEVDPRSKDGSVQAAASTFVRFSKELQIGDTAITYSPAVRTYFLGRVDSAVEAPREMDGEFLYPRRVTWTHRVLRDGLPKSARNSLGSIATLFKVKGEALKELQRLSVPIGAPDAAAPDAAKATSSRPDAGSDTEEGLAEVVAKSREFIEDMLADLDAYQMQDLVAGLLRAMGYKTRVAAPGADRGVDVFASPDGLGLEEPRIFVEVKHRIGTKISSQEVRAFMGGRQSGDRCLYVSTGGFAKDARYEAERSSVPLTLIDMPHLRELLVERYETLDDETRRLVPLTRVYWPASTDT